MSSTFKYALQKAGPTIGQLEQITEEGAVVHMTIITGLPASNDWSSGNTSTVGVFTPVQPMHKHNMDNTPDTHLVVSNNDLHVWHLLDRIDPETLKLVEWFEPKRHQLWASLLDGRLIGVGDNTHGLLGVGHEHTVTTYQEITTLRGKKVDNIQAGSLHVTMLTEAGQLWAWGGSQFGQLGLGNVEGWLMAPRLILQGVVKVATGNWHTLALMQDGKLLGWGDSRYGQLGTGNADVQTKPVAILEGEHIKAIYTGDWYSFAVNIHGQVWAWGRADEHQLAIGNNAIQWQPVRVDVHGKHVQSVVCGELNTIFLTRDSLVYVAGGEKTRPCKLDMPGHTLDHRIYYFRHLFVATTAGKLFYWEDTHSMPQPKESDSSLSQIIEQYCEFRISPTKLYIEHEADP